MSDREFIKCFKEISILEICKQEGANYANIMAGKSGYEATNRVASVLAKKLKELLDKKQTKIDFKFQ